MLFTDTDNLVFEIERDDAYEDFSEDKNLFDLVNKNVTDKMKNEVKRNITGEFVGLNAKMYSLVFVNNEEIKKVKNVNKNIVKDIRHK